MLVFGVRYMMELSSSDNPPPYNMAMLSLKVMLPPKNTLVPSAARPPFTALSKNPQSMKVAFGIKESITNDWIANNATAAVCTGLSII